MGDRMTPISFGKLMKQILTEERVKGSVFGVRNAFVADAGHALTLFGEKAETPIGPAAGPHTQLAQNIVAAYYAGARFFELKTVQKIDGEDLKVSKPCIKADDEGYNVEWSTELTVEQAFEEYVKAWFALKVMSKEFGLGAPDGFIFNMSVGYDWDGIHLPKLDRFIEGLKDAKETAVFKECQSYLLAHISSFEQLTEEDVLAIPSNISSSITLSTLHGCPAGEIERIAAYLLKEKHLNTYVKCNPTLLGYETARRTLNEMGYDYVQFGRFHFEDDLQYEDAIAMFRRLNKLAKEEGRFFGLKLTNTFPVDIKEHELPGEEMYMSGRALYPLSITLAAKFSEEFHGKLKISYSGGADFHNIQQITDVGIWPVTMATTLLKPGGYQRFTQLAKLLDDKQCRQNLSGDIKTQELSILAQKAKRNRYHRKAVKPVQTRKIDAKVPLIDCFLAPCREGCPIHQDITDYMSLVAKGEYAKALYVIMEKNPLPFITGTICSHRCMGKCTRNYYEESIHIRKMKLRAAKEGYETVLAGHKEGLKTRGRVAIVGAGPAGISAAYFLQRAGIEVTIFEGRESAGGVVRHVIPEFRIALEEVSKDLSFIERLGVEVRYNSHIDTLDTLKEMGYKNILLAVGAGKHGKNPLKYGSVIHALTFLEDFKTTEGDLDIGRRVVVIGGGNTAMDTARAAIRTKGVESVSLVYRRTKRYMPAQEEELKLAIEDGVEFLELLAPVSFQDETLICNRVSLGEADAAGRRIPVELEETVSIPADIVIAAVGEQIDTEFYQKNGLMVDDKGYPIVNSKTLQSSIPGIYIIGDGRKGPATVVEAIADATLACEDILAEKLARNVDEQKDLRDVYSKRGIICDSMDNAISKTTSAQRAEAEYQRCLSCFAVCENCVE
ncbi:MAG: putative selenate reductase subunit YgfK, partial [Clostridia bacterium]|nr:putative selenate reductase subunit YgfK [Clostridia bacterium]